MVTQCIYKCSYKTSSDVVKAFLRGRNGAEAELRGRGKAETVKAGNETEAETATPRPRQNRWRL